MELAFQVSVYKRKKPKHKQCRGFLMGNYQILIKRLDLTSLNQVVMVLASENSKFLPYQVRPFVANFRMGILTRPFTSFIIDNKPPWCCTCCTVFQTSLVHSVNDIPLVSIVRYIADKQFAVADQGFPIREVCTH